MNKHIAIEGMDGVGKSTVCQLLANRLGYKFIEKPFHYLLNNDINLYRDITKKINAIPDPNFTA
ncbi:AAA family ATPase [bacterium]|nr:AAA family ATPase [bacterium]